MKVFPFKVPKSVEDSLIYQEDHELVFYDKLHQHEEIQISLIEHGEGTLIVGDTINSFSAGDIIVIGSNIPHVFRSDNAAGSKIPSFMISLFFKRGSFGANFFDLPEFNEIDPFFLSSENGFRVQSKKKRLRKQMLELKDQTKLNRFKSFIGILIHLSNAKKKKLSSFINKKKYTENEGKRISDVFEYVMKNYNNNISLEEVANIVHMSRNAFCRYFKNRTNKTFFQFLIEIRIENACKLLSKNKEVSIKEISYKCGFNNISNFNRKFKEIKGVTPSDYRKE